MTNNAAQQVKEGIAYPAIIVEIPHQALPIASIVYDSKHLFSYANSTLDARDNAPPLIEDFTEDLAIEVISHDLHLLLVIETDEEAESILSSPSSRYHQFAQWSWRVADLAEELRDDDFPNWRGFMATTTVAERTR